MKQCLAIIKRWSLALVAVASVAIGGVVLASCAGEGGPVGGGGGGGGNNNGFEQQFRALWPADQANATYVSSNTCQNCHNGQTGGEPFHTEWTATVHASRNVGCEQCHGPGSVHAANPAKTNILTFPKVTSPIVCAQCHGPTYNEYFASKHRQLVQSPVQNGATSPASIRSSRCMSCHSGLFRTQIDEKGVDVATMSDDAIRTIATQTLNDVPHTATCATCHNPHKNTGNLDDEGQEVLLRHPVFNQDTTPVGPGTTAASFTRFNHICAQCHNGRGTSATDAALTSGTSRPSMHDSNQYNMLMGFGGYEGGGVVVRNTAHASIPGQCSTCHMPGGKHTFTVQYDRSCAPCHSAADAAARVTSVRSEILGEMYRLQTRLDAWAQQTYGDPDLWEYTSNITALGKTPPNQAGVPIQIKRARHNYYFVLRDACFGPHNAPYSLHLINVAHEGLTTLGVPRPLAKLSVSNQSILTMLKAKLAAWKEVQAQYPHED